MTTTPLLSRQHTLPFNQVINDCLVKSHAKLLSNYFCNMLRINDTSVINKMSKNFDNVLSKYSVVEMNEKTGKKTTIKGYGGFISDVIGKIFIDINEKKNVVNSIKRLLKIFTKDQIKKLRSYVPSSPDIIMEDNTDAGGKVVSPGAPNLIKTINEFISDAHKHPNDNTKFLTYFAIEILLTPSFFYWISKLDHITDKNDPNGYVPNADLLTCIRSELRGVSWDGTKYVNLSDSNADILRAYLRSIGENPDEAEEYKEYPGHSLLIKGVGTYNGEDCLFMQNSWGPAWNANFCGARPISRRVLDMVVYGAMMILPDVSGFGITKRRNLKTKKNKSFKRGTRKKR